MGYKVPAAKQSIGQNVFEFGFDRDDEYSIPKARWIRPALVETIESQQKLGAVKALLDAYAPGAFERFETLEAVEAFFDSWAEDSGISLGESSASPSS